MIQEKELLRPDPEVRDVAIVPRAPHKKTDRIVTEWA
jgi:hypothetical protein